MAFKINPISGASSFSEKKGNLVSNQWKSIDISFSSNGDTEPLWGVKGISFDTTVDSVVVKGLKDATVINVSNNKQHTGSITLLQAEIERWYLTASKTDATNMTGYSLVELDLFDLTINYPAQEDGTIARHLLSGCKFLNDPRNYSQSESEPEVTLNLSISAIEYFGEKKA